MLILVFGSNSFLGRYVTRFLDIPGYTIIKMTRKELDIYTDGTKTPLEKLLQEIIDKYQPFYIINCAEITNKRDISINKMFFVNSYFPYILGCVCNRNNIGMIHSSTNCIFPGQKRQYNTNNIPECQDNYSLSKFLGEKLPFTYNSRLCVVRSSFIGEDLTSYLYGKRNKGYPDHFWNGITCLEYVKIVKRVIERNEWNSIFQIHSTYNSQKYVSKCGPIELISDTYGLNTTVNPTETKDKGDHTLTKDIKDQLIELRDFGIHLKDNIVHLPQLFKISGKEVVLVTSAIMAKSIFTPVERFKQTLYTIETVRRHIPQAKIVLIDITDISPQFIIPLSEKCEQVIIFKHDTKTQYLSKNLGEVCIMQKFFENIDDTVETVYKITGRYWLTDEFDITKINKDLFTFKQTCSEDCFHTTFFVIPKIGIKNMITILSNIQALIKMTRTDVEHGFYFYVNHDLIDIVDTLHCQGYLSGDGSSYYG